MVTFPVLVQKCMTKLPGCKYGAHFGTGVHIEVFLILVVSTVVQGDVAFAHIVPTPQCGNY